MKVLLLGATGNLGSRIAPALLAHNHQVVLYVRSESKLRNLLPDTILSKVAIVTGNATDSAAVSDALVQNNCDAFINSAGVAAPLPFQTPRMQGIVNAVTAAGVEASQKLGRPLRCWFLGGFSSLDVPGMKGTPITSYLPVFIEHGLTYACLSAQPRENLEWSLLCPNVMKPASKAVTSLDKPGENPLTAAADAPPLWQPSYLNSIPVLGTYISLFGNALRYNTILEDCADFMAADLENKDREFVGHRVGVIEAGKAKNV